MSATHRLKLTAPDGKKRLTDTLDSEGIIKLAKNFPNNRVAIPFHRKKHAPQKKSIHTNFINVLAESDKIETFLNGKICLPAVVARINDSSDYVEIVIGEALVLHIDILSLLPQCVLLPVYCLERRIVARG